MMADLCFLCLTFDLTWLFSINWNPQYPLYLHKRGEEGGNLKPGGRMFYFDLYKIQQLISMWKASTYNGSITDWYTETFQI